MGDFNQVFQGAAGGGMAGAGVGGGYGAAIGGVLGGLGGLFGADDDKKRFQEMLEKMAGSFQGRVAPQGSAQVAGASPLTANRAGLISQLEAQARGEGPSAAQIQMREAMDRAAGAQASAAAGAGGRGINSGAAMRNAMNNTAAIQGQGARDTATMRAQEQLNAQNQLGQAIGYGINADQGLNQFNAGQQNHMQQVNMDAILRQLGLNDQSQLQALQLAMGGAGPGLGTQIMAGGATAAPQLFQMFGKKPPPAGQVG
jgi:hypothetical protein